MNGKVWYSCQDGSDGGDDRILISEIGISTSRHDKWKIHIQYIYSSIFFHTAKAIRK